MPPTLLERAVHDRESSVGRFFDTSIVLLILISVIAFSIETLPGLSVRTARALAWLETVTVIVFTIEYVVRVAAARRKTDFVFSFLGVVDLLAILPFYLALGVDLRAVRAFRLLRVLRLLKLARHDVAVRRLHAALVASREELVLFLSVAVILIYLAAVGIYYFESEAQPDVFASVFHSLWWAIVTLTTVGYGDAVPITVGGRVFTFVMLLIGLGIVAVPTGIFAAALERARDDR